MRRFWDRQWGDGYAAGLRFKRLMHFVFGHGEEPLKPGVFGAPGTTWTRWYRCECGAPRIQEGRAAMLMLESLLPYMEPTDPNAERMVAAARELVNNFGEAR